MTSKQCPNCGMDLPEMLYASHVEGCAPDEETEVVAVTGTDSLDDLFNMVPTGDDEDLFPEVEEEHGGGLAEPPSLDDEFARLVGMIDLTVGPPVAEVPVTVLDDAQLSSRYNEVREELMKRGEMINPTTQTGRDLHSQRGAYIIELRRRGLS